MTNPPSTKTSSSVNVPSVFATTSVLPILPMNRKRDRAIEFTAKNAKYCRNNLIKKRKEKEKIKYLSEKETVVTVVALIQVTK